MRLYLPRVEARLRGITASWFCHKKGHLHTIPCNEQEWDKELAYNRHFTQYINKSYIIQSTHKVRLRNQNKRRQPQMLDPRSSQLGSTTDQHETKHSNIQGLRWSIACTGIISTCNCCDSIWWVMRTQQSQNPRDQDYLSLWVGKGSEVELQQALSIYGG